MDQFRGYTVAGMFVVNFLGDLHAVPAILKHNQTWFSYADSIMPSFLFAAGFTYRLTTLRRLVQAGPSQTYARAFSRSIALVVISLMLFGFDQKFDSWNQMTSAGVWEFIARMIKAHLWEVLAIIGVVQILLMPVIAAASWVRVAALASCAVGHLALCSWFNYDFVYGRPNLLDSHFGAAGTRAWDGGVFGLLAWAMPMLAGTLTYDLVSRRRPGRAAATMLAWGAVLMLAGYGLNCLSTLYDLSPSPTPLGKASSKEVFAASPVWPSRDRLWNGSVALAPPPFVAPPPPSVRPLNYWLMDKRIVSQPFILFGTGLAAALYGLFILACDLGTLRAGLFRTFGRNPLAAYIVHEAVSKAMHDIVPDDSALWWCLVGLAIFFGLTYLAIRYLERNGIFIRV
jgi:predicted acyltransferase